MSRGMSFGPTKAEQAAVDRRRRVKDTVLALLQSCHTVTAGDVYAALDHDVEPTISPANSGNILAMLAREGVLADVMGVRGAHQHNAVLYTLPPRRQISLPIRPVEGMRPLTKQDLMVGKARPRREPYVSMMDRPADACVVADVNSVADAAQINPEPPDACDVTLVWPPKKPVTNTYEQLLEDDV